jgi:hypothetical protein
MQYNMMVANITNFLCDSIESIKDKFVMAPNKNLYAKSKRIMELEDIEM